MEESSWIGGGKGGKQGGDGSGGSLGNKLIRALFSFDGIDKDESKSNDGVRDSFTSSSFLFPTRSCSKNGLKVGVQVHSSQERSQKGTNLENSGSLTKERRSGAFVNELIAGQDQGFDCIVRLIFGALGIGGGRSISKKTFAQTVQNIGKIVNGLGDLGELVRTVDDRID